MDTTQEGTLDEIVLAADQIREAIKDLEIIRGVPLDTDHLSLSIWFAQSLVTFYRVEPRRRRSGKARSASGNTVILAQLFRSPSKVDLATRLANAGWRRGPGNPDKQRYLVGVELTPEPTDYMSSGIAAVLRARGLEDTVTEEDRQAIITAPTSEDESRVTVGLRRVLASRGVDVIESEARGESS